MPPADGVAHRPIKGFPGYFIGADGIVWSARVRGRAALVLRPVWEWEQLSAYRRPYGSRYVVVCMRPKPGGRVWQKYVHRLVLEAFVGPCPDGTEGCHNDGDTANNRVENLRWDTHGANMADARRHGTGGGKVPADAVRSIRREYAAGVRPCVLALRHGLSPEHALQIIHRKIYRYVEDSPA